MGLLTFRRGTPPAAVLQDMAAEFEAAYTVRGEGAACAAIGADRVPHGRDLP